MNPHITAIKHMAFAVRDAAAARARYEGVLDAPQGGVVDWPGSRTRVAIFMLAGVEHQLCQSMDPNGRFDRWIAARGAEGLHHVCYAVADIGAALAHATAHGATLRECEACKVTGSHPHPEGHVAFLDTELGGIEVEFMQVYTPAELEHYKAVKGI